MRFIDRFTRDEVSAKVWWPLALLCLVALVGTIPAANRAADQVRNETAARVAAFSTDVLQPLITAGATSEQLTAAAQQQIAGDPRLTAVRIWGGDHLLVISSSRTDQLDSGEALNDADIDAAVSAGAIWIVTDRLATGDVGPTTYFAYAPIPVTGSTLVTQFEAPDATLLADVHDDWMYYRITLGVAFLLLLSFAGLSMREPIAPIGAKVPFYATSVPRWLQVIDVDRAVALEQAGGRAKDRVAGLQQKLDESERLRLKAEGQLQQALASRNLAGRGAPSPAVPDAASAAASAVARPTPEAATAAVAAAATKRQKSAPAPAPVTVQPAVIEAAPMPEPPVVTMPEVEPVTVLEDDIEIVATPQATHDAGGWPEVVVLPDAQPAHMAITSPGVRYAESEPASAREVLDRLVQPTVVPDPADDPSVMRAKLARTAALKKPGSKERQEEREAPPEQPSR